MPAGCGAVGAAGHRQAHPVRRHRREIRSVGAVPARTHCLAHSRHGRCSVAGRAGSGQVDQEKAEKLAKKISKGKSFDLSDLRDQLSQLANMGGMSALLDKLPAQLQANAAAAAGRSMPKASSARWDHRFDDSTRAPAPDSIDGSRKRRIAAGAGCSCRRSIGC